MLFLPRLFATYQREQKDLCAGAYEFPVVVLHRTDLKLITRAAAQRHSTLDSYQPYPVEVVESNCEIEADEPAAN